MAWGSFRAPSSPTYAAAFAFYAVLFLAGSQDVLAALLGLAVETMVIVERVSLVVVPLLVGLIAYRWAKDLAPSAPT